MARLQVRDEVLGKGLCIVAVGLHEALEGGRSRVHAHAVKVGVTCLALQTASHTQTPINSIVLSPTRSRCGLPVLH